MSFDAIKRVLDYSSSTGSSRLVLLVLAYHEGVDNVAWPSVDRLAEKASVSRRQVIRAIAGLESAGEIAVNRGKGRSVNSYTVLVGLSDEGKSRAIEILSRFNLHRTSANFPSPDSGNGDTVTPQNPPSSDKVSPQSPTNSDMVSPQTNIYGDISAGYGDISAGSGDISAACGDIVTPESLIESINESPKEINLTWQKLIDQLRPQVERSFYETWIPPLQPIGWQGNSFRVKAVGPYQQNFLNDRIGSMVNRIFPAVVNRPGVRIEFIS